MSDEVKIELVIMKDVFATSGYLRKGDFVSVEIIEAYLLILGGYAQPVLSCLELQTLLIKRL